VLGPRQFDGVKTKRLFQILVLGRGRPVSKDQLADLLWQHEAPRNVAGTLGTYVSVLRRRVGLDDLIETSPNSYRYVPERGDLDLDRFDRLTELAATAGPAQARRHLEAALRLVRGEPLEDEPYADWAETHRGVYRKKIGAAVLLAAETALACRDHDAAVAHAERAVELEPLSEAAHRALMLGLYALGRQDRAMAAFDRLRTVLGDELGLRPMDETWALLRSIHAHDPLARLLPPPAWDDPPATIDLRAPHIPLLGRTAEIRVVEGAVARARGGATSLVIIEGEAGKGKSRLLAEVTDGLHDVRVGRARCSRLERDLPFVPLLRALRSALATTTGTVLAERSLDLAVAGNAGTRSVLEGIADLVDAHGPVVLVLDDAHWADPSTITALAFLSAGDHPLTILATLRPSLVTPEDALYWLEPRARLRLGPLTAEDLLPLGAPDLHRLTRGHPMLVAEWVQADAEGALDELPVRLGLWIREQSGSDSAHRLLVTAALTEEPFELEDLTAVLGPLSAELVDDVEALLRRGLLELREDGLYFRHPLLREALWASVSPSRRRLLRAALAGHVPVAAAV
jgi:DNA-binding SARP family transcriptional activator